MFALLPGSFRKDLMSLLVFVRVWKHFDQLNNKKTSVICLCVFPPGGVFSVRSFLQYANGTVLELCKRISAKNWTLSECRTVVLRPNFTSHVMMCEMPPLTRGHGCLKKKKKPFLLLIKFFMRALVFTGFYFICTSLFMCWKQTCSCSICDFKTSIQVDL